MSNLSTLAKLQMKTKKPDAVIPWDDKTMCSFCGAGKQLGRCPIPDCRRVICRPCFDAFKRSTCRGHSTCYCGFLGPYKCEECGIRICRTHLQMDTPDECALCNEGTCKEHRMKFFCHVCAFCQVAVLSHPDPFLPSA